MEIFSADSAYAHDPAILKRPDTGYEHYFGDVAARLDSLRSGLSDAGFAAWKPPSDVGLDPILAVHDERLVAVVSDGLRRAAEEGETLDVLLAETFPRGGRTAGSGAVWADVGAHMFDTSSPIFPGTYRAAYDAAQCAVAAADAVAAGLDTAMALVRPPGHHAMRDLCGGFCYFNNAAIATARLIAGGARVAVLDVDVHHGNGTQEIFWDTDTLTVSLHMDPHYEYPFYWGFADETGGAAGSNLNLALAAHTDDRAYLEALEVACVRIATYAPDVLVAALGVDTFRLDPIGRFDLTSDVYPRIAQRIRTLAPRMVITQEGGYHLPTLGLNVAAFVTGLGG